MELSQRFVRKHLERIHPFTKACSLEATRRGQDLLGNVLAKTMRTNVNIVPVDHPKLSGNVEPCACFAIPHDELKRGVILYLHGGGYTCGDIEYAKGFGSVLASECGIRVLCLAYRLAPENPFPAALDDAVEAYRYLLSLGYLSSQIVLAGESAGGGLWFSLCLKLRQLDLPLPCSIIAISPWTDLTQSGESFIFNHDVDPSLCKETLDFYSKCYSQNPTDPLVSPLFGDVSGLPPSLIFAGKDEVLLDDSRRMHNKLVSSGCTSELVEAEGMWHAYVLYCIKERACDLDRINAFLNRFLSHERKLRWMRLDNAAKIYPAAKRRKWNNFFRLSATLCDEVDKTVLRNAMDVTMRRFPSIAVRLCRGAFWYYLEELSSAPEITDEKSWPLAHTPFESINECALRVIVYKNRIAVEFYHALTDGTGGMVFLKSLLAEYIEQKYGVEIPNECGVLDRLTQPQEEELEDSFSKNAGSVSVSRNASTAFKIHYTPERDDFRHLTTFILDSNAALAAAKSCGVSLTVYLTSAMLLALQRIQDEQTPDKRRQKPIRVVVPVNLRRLFPSRTLRNFVHVIMPEIDPRMGDYEFSEILTSVKHQLGLLVTKKNLCAMFTPNVNAERSPLLRVMPLFLKNIAMKLVYDTVGERTNCLNLSNLGDIKVPDAMRRYVTRFDFILGVQATKPNNCGVLSYNGKLYMNFIRNTVEPVLEFQFYQVLRELGLHVKVESNGAGNVLIPN